MDDKERTKKLREVMRVFRAIPHSAIIAEIKSKRYCSEEDLLEELHKLGRSASSDQVGYICELHHQIRAYRVELSRRPYVHQERYLAKWAERRTRTIEGVCFQFCPHFQFWLNFSAGKPVARAALLTTDRRLYLKPEQLREPAVRLVNTLSQESNGYVFEILESKPNRFGRTLRANWLTDKAETKTSFFAWPHLDQQFYYLSKGHKHGARICQQVTLREFESRAQKLEAELI